MGQFAFVSNTGEHSLKNELVFKGCHARLSFYDRGNLDCRMEGGGLSYGCVYTEDGFGVVCTSE